MISSLVEDGQEGKMVEGVKCSAGSLGSGSHPRTDADAAVAAGTAG